MPHTTPDWVEKTAEKAKFVIDCHDGPNIWHRAKTPAYWLAKEFLDRQPLIAAAPALLEALEKMLKTHDPCDTTDEMEDARHEARAAIAAARGDSPKADTKSVDRSNAEAVGMFVKDALRSLSWSRDDLADNAGCTLTDVDRVIAGRRVADSILNRIVDALESAARGEVTK